MSGGALSCGALSTGLCLPCDDLESSDDAEPGCGDEPRPSLCLMVGEWLGSLLWGLVLRRRGETCAGCGDVASARGEWARRLRAAAFCAPATADTARCVVVVEASERASSAVKSSAESWL